MITNQHIIEKKFAFFWFQYYSGCCLCNRIFIFDMATFFALLWFIITDENDEIKTIWCERKGPDMVSYDLGIYLNRIDLFGKAIGRTVIKSALDAIISERDVQELYLDVSKENLRAFRCYESLGFKTVGSTIKLLK